MRCGWKGEQGEEKRRSGMEYKESLVKILEELNACLEMRKRAKETSEIPEVSLQDILDELTVPNENPTVVKARVQCTHMEDKNREVIVVTPPPGADERNGGLGLHERDITLKPDTFGFCKQLKRPCKPVILGKRWLGCDMGNLINGMPSVHMSSYMICSVGDGYISLKTNGQRVGSSKKGYVTLEMFQDVPEKTVKEEGYEKFETWIYKEVVAYDLNTSLPEYGKTYAFSQEDVDEVNRVLEKYEINTPERIACFLANCAVESGSGSKPLEQYDGGDIFEYFREYEIGDTAKQLGNTQEGDGAKYRGVGAIQFTGRNAYTRFSEYAGDPKILEDGALYVGKECFWEAAGYYWSVYKPGDGFDFNGLCDEMAEMVEAAETEGEAEAVLAEKFHEIVGMINSGTKEHTRETDRRNYYDYYLNLLKENE